MRTVTIEKLRCLDNEDWLQNQDEIHIDGLSDGTRAMRISKDIRKGQTWAPNRSFRINRGGAIQLWERNPASKHDLLGQVSVRSPGRYRVPMRRNGYHYELTYSVSQPNRTSSFFSTFRPSRHSLRLRNSFDSRDVANALGMGQIPQPFRGWIDGAFGGNWASAGLCGGIASAIADFYHAKRRVPQNRPQPGGDDPMFRYLVRRQMDTFKPGVAYAAKFLEWMFIDPVLVRHETLKEARKLAQKLDRGELVVLGLLRTRGASDPSNNHQVLAYDYTGSANGVMRVKICEPNYVGHDHLELEVRKRRVEITLELARRLDRDFKRMNLPMPDWLEDLVASLLRGFSFFADGVLPDWAKRIVVHRMDVATARMVERRAPSSGARLNRDDRVCHGFFVMPYRKVKPPASL